MGLKDLFIVSDDDKGGKTEVSKPSNKTTTKFPKEIKFDEDVFPTEETKPSKKFSSTSTLSANQPLDEHITKFREMYKNGFDSLNQEGFDFYDFFQAVIHGGIDNPQVYNMAMGMGSAMDKTITKDILLQQAEFYQNEISKVHAKQASGGGAKMQQAIAQKDQDNSSLSEEIQQLKQQANEIATQIRLKETELASINNKYQPILDDVNSKLMANDLAKNEILTTITTVKNGIIKNLK